MNDCLSQFQMPPMGPGLMYVSALAVGAVLIATKSATPAEASGYIAPFLVIYERMLSGPEYGGPRRPTAHKTAPYWQQKRW